MPTQATIAITPGLGQLLDAVSIVIGANTVVRETMVLADPTNATYLATITVGGALLVDATATTQPVNLTQIGGAAFSLGQQLAAASAPVVLPATQITALTPPTAAAIASAIVANPPTVAVSGNVTVVGTGTFVVQATLAAETTKVIGTVNQGTSPWIISGAVTTSGTATIVGTLTHNNAAPAATNIGVLPALANAAAPTFNEGDQVLLSTDLSGALRVNAVFTGTVSQNVTQWNSVSLGSPSAYGTAPGAVNVIGVNAYVTTLPAVTIAAAQTIAVTNAGTFAVQATLSAETTKVIGTINISTGQKVEVYDGTNTATVKAASTAAVATDTAVVVTEPGSTTAGACANTSVTSSSSTVLAANTARREAVIVNTDVVIIYLGFGQVPTATAYHIALKPCTVAHDGTGGSFVTDIWKGAINAIVASTSGHVAVTELT